MMGIWMFAWQKFVGMLVGSCFNSATVPVGLLALALLYGISHTHTATVCRWETASN